MVDGQTVAFTGDLGRAVGVGDLAARRPAAEPLDTRAAVRVVTTATLEGRRVALVGCGDGTVRAWDPVGRWHLRQRQALAGVGADTGGG
ncbi:hypothetical protein ACVNF4_06840 [Streptomyces sp. S6]